MITVADGSALVTLGNTTVLAGAKLEVGLPAEGGPPDQGRLVVAVEAPALCHPDIRPGPPPELALLATHHVSEALRAADALDLTSLCIAPGKAVWVLYLDISILDADGGEADAALAAALAALRDVRTPRVDLDDEGNVVLAKGDANSPGAAPGRLRIRGWPSSVTCGLFRGQVLVDLTRDEERVVDSLVSCCVDEGGRVLRVFKPGGRQDLDRVSLAAAVHLAAQRAREERAQNP